jgi:hypothetical protein
MMNRVLLVCMVSAMVIVGSAHAQRFMDDAKVHIQAGYATAITAWSGVERAAGPSLHARAEIPVVSVFGISAAFNFDRLRVTQPDAVENWDWEYWERLWRTYSTLYREREDHSAEFRPVQNANLLSFGLAPALILGNDRAKVSAWTGMSYNYFTRTLYQEETWTRFYPSVDHTFSYTIRNYAQDKTGWALGVDFGAAASYRLVPWLSLGAGAGFRHYLDANEVDFPLNDLLSFDVGFVVHY